MKHYILKLISFLLSFAIVLSVCFTTTVSAVTVKSTISYKDYIVNRGNGLKNTYAKLKAGEEVNIFYFGGSLVNGTTATPGNCFRELTGKWLERNFPNATINNYNVAYGGTGTWLGLHRMYDEILSKEPDLVFIEFALNDLHEYVSPKDASMQLETIIRTIRKQAPDCDIVNLISTQETAIYDLITDDLPFSQAIAHIEIADAYNVPTLNIGHALADHLYQEAGYNYSEIWKDYMYDSCHPLDKGHKIYANVIEEYLESQLINGNHNGKIVNHTIPNLVNDYLHDGDMQYIDVDENLINQSFAFGGKDFEYEQFSNGIGIFKDGAVGDRSTSRFVVKFTGTELSMLYKTSTNFNGFVVTVDGEDYFAVKHKNVAVLVSGIEYGEHTAEIRFSYKQGSSDIMNIYAFYTRNENKASHKHKYDNKCDKNCNVCGSARITSHTYKTVTTKATTKKNGSIVNKCSGCGKTTGTKTTIYYAKKVKLSLPIVWPDI